MPGHAGHLSHLAPLPFSLSPFPFPPVVRGGAFSFLNVDLRTTSAYGPKCYRRPVFPPQPRYLMRTSASLTPCAPSLPPALAPPASRILICSLLLLLIPAAAFAQTDPCGWAPYRFAPIPHDGPLLDATALRRTLGHLEEQFLTATEAETRIQLLDRRLIILDAMGVFDEAEAAVADFFAHLSEQASDAWRLYFYAWQTRYLTQQGRYTRALIAFDTFRPLIEAAPPSERVFLLLAGGGLYGHTGAYADALAISAEVVALLDTTGMDHTNARIARACAIHLEGQSLLGQALHTGDEPDLRPALEHLREAARQMIEARTPDGFVVVATSLGAAYLAQGDTATALSQLTQAVETARVLHRNQVAVEARYRRGHLYLAMKHLDLAVTDLQVALVEAKATGEARFQGPGLAYEALGQTGEAEEAYAAVLLEEAAFPEALRARVQAQAGLMRLEKRPDLSYVLFSIIALLLLYGAWQGLQRFTRIELPDFVLEAEEPTPDPPEVEDEESPISLFTRRLKLIHLLLFQAEETLPMLDDPVLAEQLRARRIKNNQTLFLMVAALEESLYDKQFENNAANTIGAYLRKEFQRRKLHWPQRPAMWKKWLKSQSEG